MVLLGMKYQIIYMMLLFVIRMNATQLRLNAPSHR